MQHSSLFLNDNRRSYHIHPVAIMTILNHHQRRKETQDYVIGFLFGRYDNNDNQVYITSAFPTQHQLILNGDDESKVEPGNDNDRAESFYSVSVNAALNEKIMKLHALSEPNDSLVGWYSTSLNIDDNSGAIHSSFLDYTDDSFQNDFIHVLVDTLLNNSRLSIKGYICTAVDDPLQKQQQLQLQNEQKQNDQQQKDQEEESGNDFGPLFTKFEEVSLSYVASESEKIGIDMMIRCPPDNDALDAPATLTTDMNNLEMTLQELLEKIESVSRYVQSVQKGEIEGDESIGWMIGEALSSVPLISAGKFEEMLSTRLQDLLMIVYLSKLTKAQLTMADKINHILHRTLP